MATLENLRAEAELALRDEGFWEPTSPEQPLNAQEWRRAFNSAISKCSKWGEFQEQLAERLGATPSE